MVDLAARQVLYANEVAAQMAPGLDLPVSADQWSAAADLRDLDGEALDETAHPLSRIARFEPVAGQGVSAARGSDLGQRREPLWVVALPLDDAPNLSGYALVVFLPVRDREELQDRAHAAHDRSGDISRDAGNGAGDDEAAGGGTISQAPPAAEDARAVREAAVLATGLSFTVADANDPDLALVWVNPAFTAVTGYTFERAVGHNCRFLQGPGTDRDVTARMRTALEAGRSITETLLNFRADGTAFWNQVAMSPIVDAAGVVTHYVGIQTDVSGRVAADVERDRALAAEQQARSHAEAARGEAVLARERAEGARLQAEAAHQRLELLAEVTSQLSETTDAQLACQRLAHLVVPVLGDFVVLATASDAGGAYGAAGGTATALELATLSRVGRYGLRDVAWHHRDPDLLAALGTHAGQRLSALTDRGREALTELLSGSGVLSAGVVTEGTVSAEVVGAATPPKAPESSGMASAGATEAVSGESGAWTRAQEQLVPGPALEALRRLAPTSLATWALRSGGRTLGLLTVGTGPGREPLQPDDFTLGSDIAIRAGLALDRARLFRQQRDLASGMQRSLLQLSPRAAPEHVQVAVRYVAAAEAAQVGGDFYDVFTQADGSAVLVIGDVMGHDTQAAAAMAQLRSIVRTLGMAGEDSPAVVLKRTDHMMRASGVDTTATATVVRLLPPTGGAAQLQWSNAGHPPPVIIEPGGQVRLLQVASTDLLLGVDPLTARQLNVAQVPVGSVLVLYTDGLVERRDQSLSEGLDRLLGVVAGAAAALGVSASTTSPSGGQEGAAGALEDLVEAVLERMLPAAAVVPDDVAVVVARIC